MAAPPLQAHIAPPAEVIEAMLAPSTRVVRYVQLCYSDGREWKPIEQVGVLDGSVSVDQTRAERRTFSLELDNRDGSVRHAKGQLWYDKIVKIWRGIQYGAPTARQEWTTQIGEFMIDSIKSQNFPHTIAITGRDYTKKLINSEFKVPTGFPAGTSIDALIKIIATNGGINPQKMIIPSTGHTLGEDTYYDSGSKRWDAISKLAEPFGYEVYFDGAGFMIMRAFQDPAGTGTSFTFKTGPDGSLATYQKESNDSRLYNTVAVIGEASDQLPIYGIAENHEPSSSTSIEQIGERVYNYKTPFIYTQDQADAVAKQFLSFHSLEEYTVTLDSIVFPWFEAGDVVDFIDPDPDPDQPTRFLLSSFTIPLKLGSMSLTTKRVVIV
jgi:hypothetical protein